MVETLNSEERRQPSGRIEALDLARGIAVTLMILSHGVKGLLSFEQFTPWGLVPIHLITKFSSTLFFIVFGMSLAVAFVPAVGTERWSQKRNRLVLRGLKILFWYKVLTVVEMFHQFEPQQIIDTLLYRSFTSYVEILGFYAFALLWIPFVLPWWRVLPLWARLLVPLGFSGLAQVLYWNFNFWNNESLQAILVEHRDHYTWGQLTRAPLVFLGLIFGDFIRERNHDMRSRLGICAVLAGISVFLFGGFAATVYPALQPALQDIALNDGKHPPELSFMLFSMAGAFFILALTLAGGGALAWALRPLTIIGRDALQAFIFHISVLFVVYRFLLDYWLKVSYEKALFLAVLLVLMTAVWIRMVLWLRKFS